MFIKKIILSTVLFFTFCFITYAQSKSDVTQKGLKNEVHITQIGEGHQSTIKQAGNKNYSRQNIGSSNSDHIDASVDIKGNKNRSIQEGSSASRLTMDISVRGHSNRAKQYTNRDPNSSMKIKQVGNNNFGQQSLLHAKNRHQLISQAGNNNRAVQHSNWGMHRYSQGNNVKQKIIQTGNNNFGKQISRADKTQMMITQGGSSNHAFLKSLSESNSAKVWQRERGNYVLITQR